MQQYKNKQELINEINKTYELFIREFDDVNNLDIHKRVVTVDKTPSEMISYQIGWLNNVMQWEKDEIAGKKVITPSPNFKWNEVGKLYQTFYDKYAGDNLETLLKNFKNQKKNLLIG